MDNEKDNIPQEFIQKPQKEGGAGPIIASVIVILIIVLGGLYFWGAIIESRLKEKGYSDSLNLDDIKEDIEGNDLEDLDKELDAIDAEIEASL